MNVAMNLGNILLRKLVAKVLGSNRCIAKRECGYGIKESEDYRR